MGSLTGGATSGKGNVTLGANNLTIGGDNTSPASYLGIMSGVGGSLTKIGTGKLTLGGPNTYTGITTVSNGIINLAAAEVVGTSGPLGASAASNPGSIVMAGGQLQYSGANQNDYSGRFSTAAGQVIISAKHTTNMLDVNDIFLFRVCSL